jgi:hypothetical protein
MRRLGSINPHGGLGWQGMWLPGTRLTVVADGEPEQKR